MAVGPSVPTSGADRLRAADRCGGCGRSAGPELLGGRAVAESAGAGGGGPGWGQDPHLPASAEGADGPAAVEGVGLSSQARQVQGVMVL